MYLIILGEQLEKNTLLAAGSTVIYLNSPAIVSVTLKSKSFFLDLQTSLCVPPFLI